MGDHSTHYVKKKTQDAIELKGKTKLTKGSKCGLKKTIAQKKQCDQSRNQKRLKVWLKKLLVILKS